MRNQPILLLDEPFSALDREVKKEMLHLVKDIQHEKNLTIILVTHDLQEAEFLADRILYLNNGKAVNDLNGML